MIFLLSPKASIDDSRLSVFFRFFSSPPKKNRLVFLLPIEMSVARRWGLTGPRPGTRRFGPFASHLSHNQNPVKSEG